MDDNEKKGSNILFKELSYDDKVSYYSNYFSSGYFLSKKLDNKLLLINLICLVTKKIREQDGQTTCQVVIEKILQHPLRIDSAMDRYLIGLSIVCEDMLYGVTEINPMGLKTSGEIIGKIKELLNEWSPF